MRAAVSLRFGPPEVVRVCDVPVPKPSKDDVRVAVHSTTVNRTDCHYRSGRPLLMHAVAGWRRPRATVLGTEYAGVVEDLGPGAEGIARGDRVFGWIEGRFGAHAVQTTLTEHRRDHGFAPQVRIGVHAAEAVDLGHDYLGKGVHEAARVGAAAGAQRDPRD